MKRFIFKITGNILLIALSIGIIQLIGLKQDFAYIDEGPNIIDIYSDGNIEILEIEGISVDGKPIRIQNGKPYDGLIVEMNYETIRLNDAFTFNNDKGQQSLTFIHSSSDDFLYIERNYEYIMGMSTFAFVFAIVGVYNFLMIGINIARLFESKKSQGNIFKIDFFQHVCLICRRCILIPLGMFGIGFLLVSLIDPLYIILYSLSDPQAFYGALGLLVVIFVFSVLFELKTNRTVITFENNRMNVCRGQRVLFDEPLSSIEVREIMIGNTGNAFLHEYTALKLELKSTVTGENLSLDLLGFGETKYREIRNRIRIAKEPTTFNQESLSNTPIELYARDVSSVKKQLIVIIGIAISAFIMVFVAVWLLDISMVWAVMIALIVDMILMIAAMFKIAKRMKPMQFKVSPSYIMVDDEMFDNHSIQSISLKYPGEVSAVARVIELKTDNGTHRWQIPANGAIGKKYVDTNKNYEKFYETVRYCYPDKLKEH